MKKIIPKISSKQSVLLVTKCLSHSLSKTTEIIKIIIIYVPFQTD